MTEKKSWGSTVLGWFVEREGDGRSAAEEADSAAANEGASAPEAAIRPIELKGEVPLPAEPGGVIDFSAIYRAAGLGEAEQGRIDKALELLKTLPAETPKEVKRQIVEASLKAFGYPIEQIIEAGVAEIRALHAFIEFSQRSTQKVLAETNARIEELSREIEELRAFLEKKASAQQALAHQSNRQKLQVQEVLEFFGQDEVARVLGGSSRPADPASPSRPAADPAGQK